MICSNDKKFFVLDFIKTGEGYQPVGAPLQLSESSHIMKMIFAEEGISVPPSSPLSEVIFFEDSVLMQAIARILAFAKKSYAYVKSYNDKKYKGYHAVIVSEDHNRTCNSGTTPQLLTSTHSLMGSQSLMLQNTFSPQAPMQTFPNEPSNDHIKDLSDACEQYNAEMFAELLGPNFLQDTFQLPSFNPPWPSIANKDNTDTSTAAKPIPTIEGLHESATPYAGNLDVSTLSPDALTMEVTGLDPTNNQVFPSDSALKSSFKPENTEVTVTLRDVLLRTPEHSPEKTAVGALTPRSRDGYATRNDPA
ncbi:hypothetical protein BDV28DRAFT_152003 [Aspergillus coremiiformis]|uniref:Uncharacterized protein n=1 Tax=Aspergillus coremiiformis TaxID=138285 RepID=A0A5N6YXE1_9EURO|nr:hypothetical protein BDV28DRAFT_152003 [Aspergillus coremiiformis]